MFTSCVKNVVIASYGGSWLSPVSILEVLRTSINIISCEVLDWFLRTVSVPIFHKSLCSCLWESVWVYISVGVLPHRVINTFFARNVGMVLCEILKWFLRTLFVSQNPFPNILQGGMFLFRAKSVCKVSLIETLCAWPCVPVRSHVRSCIPTRAYVYTYVGPQWPRPFEAPAYIYIYIYIYIEIINRSFITGFRNVLGNVMKVFTVCSHKVLHIWIFWMQ